MTQQGTGYTGISNYLKTTLIPSVATIRTANIYDHELTDLGGYPAVTITSQELMGKFLDNQRNMRVYRFTIRVFIDRNTKNFGTEKAETILRSVADELITKIDADPSLGGNCIYTTPFTAKFGYVERQNNDIRMMELMLDCVDAIIWR